MTFCHLPMPFVWLWHEEPAWPRGKTMTKRVLRFDRKGDSALEFVVVADRLEQFGQDIHAATDIDDVARQGGLTGCV